MPRLLFRALLVLGGATAATAAVWLLSSGTASAAEMPSVPQVPGLTARVMSTSDMGVSTTVSSVADAVTEPSQDAVLPLPAVPTAAPAGLGQLTTGLRDTVGQFGDKLPVDKDLPAQLVQHLGRTPVSTPAVPTVAVPALPSTPRHLPMQPAPFAGQHDRSGGVVDQTGDAYSGANGAPRGPRNPGDSPFGPLTVPVMPGSGSGNGGFAGPAGVGLASGIAEHLFPELHVVDVLAPAIEPARVMPGKQPGVTPD
jgi:hypothetical protein